MIPAADPGARLAAHRDEVVEALSAVVDGGSYILGDRVRRFEDEFAAAVGTTHCVGVSSGAAAITLALLAAGIGPGDEVITTGLTAPPTVTAIAVSGAEPVAVDVDDRTLAVSVDEVRAAIGSRTAAIVPVHLHGTPAPVAQLRRIADERGLFLLEDAAQAHGALIDGGPARAGSVGHAGAFSFYPTKNLGAIGDAGAVTTDDPALAAEIRRRRSHGVDADGRVCVVASNERMDDVQAAVLSVLLPHLDSDNATRVGFADAYRHALGGWSGWLPAEVPGAVYHQFCVRLPDRDRFRRELAAGGVGSAIHYPHTIAEHPALGAWCRDLPVASRAVGELVSLPIQPEILLSLQQPVLEEVSRCLARQ